MLFNVFYKSKMIQEKKNRSNGGNGIVTSGNINSMPEY